jgi:hypothetical protein
VSKPTEAVFRVPRTVARCELGAEYPGAWVELWLNPGVRVLEVIRAELARQAAGARAPDSTAPPSYPDRAFRPALSIILVGWNLADADGRPLPATVKGLEALDWPELFALMWAWLTARALPKPSAPPSPNGSTAPAAASPSGSSRPSTAVAST